MMKPVYKKKTFDTSFTMGILSNAIIVTMCIFCIIGFYIGNFLLGWISICIFIAYAWISQFIFHFEIDISVSKIVLSKFLVGKCIFSIIHNRSSEEIIEEENGYSILLKDKDRQLRIAYEQEQGDMTIEDVLWLGFNFNGIKAYFRLNSEQKAKGMFEEIKSVIRESK